MLTEQVNIFHALEGPHFKKKILAQQGKNISYIKKRVRYLNNCLLSKEK